MARRGKEAAIEVATEGVPVRCRYGAVVARRGKEAEIEAATEGVPVRCRYGAVVARRDKEAEIEVTEDVFVASFSTTSRA